MTNATAFISYAWGNNTEHKKWVMELATKLRKDGVEVRLDTWELTPGDHLAHFMEQSIAQNDYVLIICTPEYKRKSDDRIGGVGYENNIITAEILGKSHHRKFIPILQSGTTNDAIPASLQGKYYIDLSNTESFERNYPDLITTLLGTREKAPPMKKEPVQSKNATENFQQENDPVETAIKIEGIIVDEVTDPRNDGTPGSALYKVPFKLSKIPDPYWAELFIQSWNSPSLFSSMHRSGIASIIDDKIILDGTTVEEIEQWHKKTLKRAVEEANNAFFDFKRQRKIQENKAKRLQEEHQKNVKNFSDRIKFD